MTEQQQKINKAITLIIGHSQVEGGHHKLWVIDQVLRVLAGDEYEKVIFIHNMGRVCSDEEEVNMWNCGIAPNVVREDIL